MLSDLPLRGPIGRRCAKARCQFRQLELLPPASEAKRACVFRWHQYVLDKGGLCRGSALCRVAAWYDFCLRRAVIQIFCTAKSTPRGVFFCCVILKICFPKKPFLSILKKVHQIFAFYDII